MVLSEEAMERIAEAYHDAIQVARGKKIETYLKLGKAIPDPIKVAPVDWIPTVVRAVMNDPDVFSHIRSMGEIEVFRQLCWLHLDAARKHDEERRARLFDLMDELEWAMPEAAKRFNEMYSIEDEG